VATGRGGGVVKLGLCGILVVVGAVVRPFALLATWLRVAFLVPGGHRVAREWGGRAANDALSWLRGRHRPGGVLAVDAAGVRLPDGSPCVICGGLIDYGLRYPHPDSLSLEHVQSRSRFPELTWVRSNWAPSHLHCNSAKGAREESPGGEFPETYW
jgi:hypothetical protein